MATRTVHTKTFTATSDSGQVFTVYEFTDYLDAGAGQEIEGLKSLRTSDGHRVNRISKGSYEIVGRPMIPIRSNDPNAT